MRPRLDLLSLQFEVWLTLAFGKLHCFIRQLPTARRDVTDVDRDKVKSRNHHRDLRQDEVAGNLLSAGAAPDGPRSRPQSF